MNEEEKRRRLAEIRKAQEVFAKESAKNALPVDPKLPRIGSFAEDEPEIHQSFANQENKG